MEFYYVNNRGVRISLSDFPYRFQSGDLLNWSYSYSTKSLTTMDVTSDYKIPAKEIPVQIAVICDFTIPLEQRKEEWEAAVDYLCEVLSADVIDNKNGRLYTDTGFYMECKIIGSEKSDWKMGLPIMFNTMKILSDHPFWISETTYNFYSYDTVLSSNNKNYPGRYAYRYANGLSNAYIQNPHFSDANFDLIIYGPVVNPQVTIGEIPYLVNIVLEAGEYLKIDSRAGTVTKVMANGEIVNAFHNRQKGRQFFKKIPPGRHSVSWPGTFAWDIIIYEERSEPKWNVLQQQ